MYDIKAKADPFYVLFGSIFFFVGVLLLTIFVSIGLNLETDSDTYDSETRIIDYTTYCHTDSDGDYMCTPTFDYEVNGVTYHCASSMATNKSDFGEYKTIKYSSSEPGICKSDYDISSGRIFLYFSFVPLIAVVIGLCAYYKAFGVKKKIKKLNQVGILVKNLPYYIANSNIVVNGRTLPAIMVEYQFPNGEKRTLKGNARYDKKTIDDDGHVDLVYDPDDYSNYYIDFNINQNY